ncbi:hypothetical protein DL765_000520 [Monosporascus sp. GIB2]|nr:hypothetical protein DL765_000520 [Monosporascus sp. GIB2]
MSCSIGKSLSQAGWRIRLLETHDITSTEIIRNVIGSDGKTQFHGQWVSGLTQTTILGVPDTELITPLCRANLISIHESVDGQPTERRELCTAFDADSGGPVEEIPALIATLARKGVSVIIIEDKEVFEPGKKVNSLAASSASQGQANPQEFAKVMAAFKDAKKRGGQGHMLVTARIESFTCRKVIENDPAAETESVKEALHQALDRAMIYRDAGADAIMIHSKSKSPDEVLSFLRQFRAQDSKTPLVVVPTTYGTTHEDALYEAGANIIIYANHMMRAKIRAVDEYLASGAAETQQVCPASLTAAADVRNFGYLLRSLQRIKAGDMQGRFNAGTDDFLASAERASYHAMEETARRLLDFKQAGAADDIIILVKDLLAINGVHLSDLGRPQEDEVLIDIFMRLMSRLRTTTIRILRNGTRWFA